MQGERQNTMGHFLDTVDTIPAGEGFALFGPVHLCRLGLYAVTAVLLARAYRRGGEEKRAKMRKTVAILLLLDELWKHFWLIAGGNWEPAYLPLHLCSINIFLTAYHAFRPGRRVAVFLYTVCIPAATIALITPTWSSLPVLNFMHLHSFSVHILLACYPIMLAAGGEARPRLRDLPGMVGILLAMAVPIYFLNPVLGANFMFLDHAPEGTPLVWFREHWGNHLLGYPPLLAALMAVMYGLGRLGEKVEGHAKAGKT